MEEHSGYYTAEFKTMSVRQLWRQIPLPAILKPLALIGFYLFRWRSGDQVAVAYRRPEALNLIDADQVPNEVLEKFTPFFHSCVDASFTLQFCYVSSGIGVGSTTIYSAVLLDATGVISAVTVCESGPSGEAVISQGSYSFQSSLTDGSLLLTTTATKDALAADLDPPHWKIVGLPLATDVHDVLTAHRERLSDVSQRPHRFDTESLKIFILSETQAYIDHGLSQGRYRWVSQSELDKIKSEPEDLR